MMTSFLLNESLALNSSIPSLTSLPSSTRALLFELMPHVRKIFLASHADTSLSVLPGRVTHDLAESKRRPTQAVGSGQYESYNNNNVYVVRHTALVLPCYVRVSVYS